MSFGKYLECVKNGNYKEAIKIEWLNPDESVNFEFTNALYDIDVNLNVNYQNGIRRTCTVVLNNNKNKFPISFNSIWIGQKFKLWRGIYINDETPYYLPQGVFYISNPTETYNPETRTITLNGVDKWAYLDGSLFGKLTGIYQTNVDTNIYDAIRGLLTLPTNDELTVLTRYVTSTNIENLFDVTNGTYYFRGNGTIFTATVKQNSATDQTARTTLTAKEDVYISFEYEVTNGITSNNFDIRVGDVVVEDISKTAIGNIKKKYSGKVLKGERIYFTYTHHWSDGSSCSFSNMVVKKKQSSNSNIIDPITPLLSPYFLHKTTEINTTDEKTGEIVKVVKPVLDCPYTVIVERGKTYADVLLEYATILCANIYYDVHGRLVFEPMIDTADDITDTNKEILWDYSVDEKTFLGLTQSYNFDKVYNDFIVLGNILNGYQFKGRVQNRNPLSNTCVQKIGLRSKEPFEDNQYVSDEQCIELAKYYAKTDTILQKSGNISSIKLFHLDVNKLVSISTPNNNMGKELFLITGFSISSSSTMTINITSVNVLKDFSVVEAEFNE